MLTRPDTTRGRSNARRLRGVPRRSAGQLAIWVLAAAYAAVAAVLAMGWLRGLEPVIDAPLRLAWWHLAPFALVAERWAVEIELRREAHAFSFADTVFVFGLFFAAPLDVFVALVLGSGAAFLLEGRQPPIKAAYNVASYALWVAVGALLFHALVRDIATLELRSAAAAVIAVGIAAVISAVAVSLAVTLAERRFDPRQLGLGVSLGLLGNLTNASVGLLAVALIDSDPRTVWLLALPGLSILLAYRGYTRQRHRRIESEFLYRGSRVLTETGDIDRALGRLVEHASRMFRVTRAEVLLFPTADGEGVRLTGDPAVVGNAVVPREPRPLLEALAARAANGDGALRPAGPRDALTAYLKARGIGQGLAVPLAGAAQPRGLLIIGDRVGAQPSFDKIDEDLLGALANQISGWLRAEQVERSLAELTRTKERLRHQAYHDELTGMPNRTLLRERLEAAVARSPAGDGCAVALIDLDDFKAINDRFGHDVGDVALRHHAERLRAHVRGTDTVARAGGDEFAVLLEGISGADDALAVATSLLRALDHPVDLGVAQAVTSASIGVAVAEPGTVTSAATLLRHADVAMYRAKERGKGRVQVYEQGMDKPMLRRLELGADLRRALGRDEVAIHYQPIIDLVEREIVGFEALLRWHHPRHGSVPPSEFIPIAEERGAISALGRWVLEGACQQLRAWQERGLGDLRRMSVNLSPVQLDQPDIVAEVAEVLQASGVAGAQLILEVTESVLMQERGLVALRELRELGVGLALDDFGTGFSSLSYLERLPLDMVKVPREFVQEITGPGGRGGLTEAVVGLARGLDLEVIAEGVETARQVAELRRYGCRFAQGFRFSHPRPAAEVTELLVALRHADHSADWWERVSIHPPG